MSHAPTCVAACLLWCMVALSAWAGESTSAAQTTDDSPSTATIAFRPLSPEKQKAFLSRMADALSEVRTLRADFVQERHIAAFLDTLTARGTCCFATPAQLRWELTEPYASILVRNGKHLAKFEMREGAWRKMDLGGEDIIRQVLGQIMGWMRGDFSATEETYSLSVFQGEGFRIVLEPHKEKMREMIQAVELDVDAAPLRVRRVTIREPGDDRIEIRFQNEAINLDLEPGTFNTKKPVPLTRGKATNDGLPSL